LGRNYWFPWRSLLIWYVAIAQSSRAANCLPSRARPRKLNTYSSSASTHLPHCSNPPHAAARRPLRAILLNARVADAGRSTPVSWMSLSLRLCLHLPRGRPPSGRASSSSNFVATHRQCACATVRVPFCSRTRMCHVREAPPADDAANRPSSFWIRGEDVGMFTAY